MLESSHVPPAPATSTSFRSLDRSARGVEEQPTRRRILETIRREPGITISNLCRRTEAGWGTVKYHLQILQRAGLVVSRSPGRDCLLFPQEYPRDELPVTEVLRRGRAASLAKAIAQSPGASQKELCARVNMTRKIIRTYVDMLTSAGLVVERRDSQFQRYYPDPRLAARFPDEPRPDPVPSSSPTLGAVERSTPAAGL